MQKQPKQNTTKTIYKTFTNTHNIKDITHQKINNLNNNTKQQLQTLKQFKPTTTRRTNNTKPLKLTSNVTKNNYNKTMEAIANTKKQLKAIQKTYRFIIKHVFKGF